MIAKNFSVQYCDHDQESRRKHKVMVVVPRITGFSGDAINERQLAEAISRHFNVEIYSLIPLGNLRELRRLYRANYLKHFNKALILPIIVYPYTLRVLLTLFMGLIYGLIAILKKPRVIYVRSSDLALPILWLKSLHKALVVVKIPSTIEDDVKGEKGFILDVKIFSWLISSIDRYALAKADIIAVPSPLLYTELCKRRGLKNPQPPILIPAGVDLEKIDKVRKLVKNAKAKDKEEYIIGFVGSITWWQGIDILVSAVNILSKYDTKLKLNLLIVGDGPLRRHIETLCKELKNDCRITGFIPHEDALKLMSSMDVLVVPRLKTSVTESVIPIKVLEAWALGVPVVITRHKVFELLGLRDGEDLIYCEPNPVSVADAICKLLRDAQLRIKTSLRGYELAKRFSYDTIVMRLLKALNLGER